jgi:hypothetical protein
MKKSLYLIRNYNTNFPVFVARYEDKGFSIVRNGKRQGQTTTTDGDLSQIEHFDQLLSKYPSPDGIHPLVVLCLPPARVLGIADDNQHMELKKAPTSQDPDRHIWTPTNELEDAHYIVSGVRAWFRRP